MSSILLFTPDRYYDIPAETKPENYPVKGKNITKFTPTAETKFFATTGISPIRFGSLACDHIKLENCNATFVITKETLQVFDASDVYLNGKKITVGDYSLLIGDCIWAGVTRIIPHNGYIEVQGEGYSATLNVATQNPAKYEEFPIFKRPPRQIYREPTDSIDLKDPPDKEEHKKGALIKKLLPPLISASMMVGIGIFIGRGMMLLMTVGMTLATITNAVFSFFSERKQKREKEQQREDDYNQYLLRKRKELQELKDAQIKSLTYHNLSPREIEHEILSNSSRIYERASGDADFLTISLGISDTLTSYAVKSSEKTEKKRDSLNEDMENVLNNHQMIKDMPTVIDLKNAHLGIVGEKLYIHRTLFSILTQLCFFQSYHDIEIILLTEEEHRNSFEWARWYPHLRIKSINVTGLITAENHRDQALGNISQMLKQRQQKSEESKKDSRYLPHYVFIADNPKLIVNHSIMEYLQASDTLLGFSLIYTTHIQANLPENIKTVFRLDGGDNGTLLMNEGELNGSPVKLPSLEGVELETMARKLAPLRHMQGISTQIPESVSFFELYNVQRPEEIPVLQLWAKNACHKSLAVPLGLRGKDDIVALNLHEKAHGPHGLVAGTTGSGKSEIVQSYILSLAVNFHPHEVGFLLIDYKGGGMANLFENLPHLLGTITNLDGSESMRALASIKSELKRRQAIFGEVGVNNINQYTKLFKSGEATLPLPHLFIISDEFAELKKEQPEFMAELVSTARIGRSLGVHLILATQKPSGVVDDQIWSNSKFKLALKVANESDSNEVLKTPDAARITQPGRAYLQVGNNEIYELFQSAWSGAPFIEDVVDKGFDSRVYEINQLGQGILLNEDLSEVDKSDESNVTQLDVVVDYVNDVHKGLNSVVVEKPWLPPLGEYLVTNAVKTGQDVGKIESINLDVPLGIVDIPDEQKQVEFSHNFLEDGNIAVFGASGFGKSTLMMNLALSLACNNSPVSLNYYILDYGNSALAQLRGLPHTADYLGLDDVEKLGKLQPLLLDELKTRKHLFASANAMNFRMYNEVADKKLPVILLFIDNCDVIREISPELEDFLVKVSRDGTGLGIYTIISASRTGAIRYSVLNNFKNKIAQFMFEKADITAVVGSSAYLVPEVRGRAMVKLKDVHIAQCYLPVPFEDDVAYGKLIGDVIAEINAHNTSHKATGIRVVPEIVTYADLTPYLKVTQKQAVLGFDIDSTDPIYLDLSITKHLIVGNSMTGKTNILKIVLTQFENTQLFISDSPAGDLQDYEEKQNVTYMGASSQFEEFYNGLSEEVERRKQALEKSELRAREFCASQPLVMVLIDDGEAFIEYSQSKSLEMGPLVTQAIELGVIFITTTFGNKLSGIDVLAKILKDVQSGIVLGNPGNQILLPIQAPRGFKPVQNIAFRFLRGDAKQVKLPFVG